MYVRVVNFCVVLCNFKKKIVKKIVKDEKGREYTKRNMQILCKRKWR